MYKPTFKVKIYGINTKWKSWTEKTLAVKKFYEPICDLILEVEELSWKPTFEDYGNGYYGIEKKIYDSMFTLPSLKANFDLVATIVEKKDWRDQSGLGWCSAPNLALYEIQVGCEENGKKNRIKTLDQTFENLFIHELSHFLYHIAGQEDNTHKWWGFSRPEMVLKEIKLTPVNTLLYYGMGRRMRALFNVFK